MNEHAKPSYHTGPEYYQHAGLLAAEALDILEQRGPFRDSASLAESEALTNVARVFANLAVASAIVQTAPTKYRAWRDVGAIYDD